MRSYDTPFPVNVDAYQAGHFRLVPPGMLDFQCSQGVYRKPLHFMDGYHADQRLVHAGMRPFVDLELSQPLTMEDIDRSTEFFSTYHASALPPYYKPYPYPEKIFRRVVSEYGGIPPIVVMAQREGQAHYVGEPHCQVFCDEPGMGELVGWIESTMLPYLWTSSIVATRNRMRMDAWIQIFKSVYPSKSREELRQMVMYKFVDFGRRGGAGSQITGLAYLMTWLCSDTCDSSYVAQYRYNGGKPFGANSIMASAHRTVTPWASEDESIANAISQFGDGFLAFVADSYDYRKCMEKLGSYAKVIQTRGGFLIGRPDSGDVVDTVLQGLSIFENTFGLDETGTAGAGGYKVLNSGGVLQGDSPSDEIVFGKLLPAVIAAGYSPACVSIGMGQNNHRAVRSETEHGYKTCLVGTGDAVYPDYRIYEPGYASSMKESGNLWKRSIPCPVGLHFLEASDGTLSDRVYPVSVSELKRGDCGEMEIVFDGRPGVKIRHPRFESWEETRKLTWESWEVLPPVPPCDTFSPEIREMQERYMAEIRSTS